jgi:hypothetical protein
MKTNKSIHGKAAPLWQLHGLKQFPPVACQFKLNDRVIFTNDYGVSFTNIIIGFSADDSFYGRFIHTIRAEGGSWEGDAGWFANHPSQIKAV